MTAATRVVDSLAVVVGAEHLREVPQEGGAASTLVVEPADVEQASQVLRVAGAAGLAVVPRGGGSKAGWGGGARRCDVVLSTRRLDALLEHEPGDLVCRVQAGLPLATLQRTLAEHRQALMLDPPHPGQTVGGVMATAASGPLRSRFGTARDLCIGVRFVLADGTVGHAGGKVVKNVAGYDLAKLLVGSLGTLAVIVEAAFRLHPLPAASSAVLLERASAAALAGFVQTLASLPLDPARADVAWPDHLALVRFDGTAEGVAEQARRLAEATGARVVGEPERQAVETALQPRPWAGEGAVLGIGVPRSRLAALLETLADHAQDAVLRAALGTGEVRVAFDVEAVVRLRAAVERLGGQVTLRRGTPDMAAALGGGDPVALELMRDVGLALDPGRVLNPGLAPWEA